VIFCLSGPDEELLQTVFVFGLIWKPFIRDSSNPWGTAENRSPFLIVFLIIYFLLVLIVFGVPVLRCSWFQRIPRITLWRLIYHFTVVLTFKSTPPYPPLPFNVSNRSSLGLENICKKMVVEESQNFSNIWSTGINSWSLKSLCWTELCFYSAIKITDARKQPWRYIRKPKPKLRYMSWRMSTTAFILSTLPCYLEEISWQTKREGSGHWSNQLRCKLKLSKQEVLSCMPNTRSSNTMLCISTEEHGHACNKIFR